MNWHYPNLTILAISLVLAFWLLQVGWLGQIVDYLGTLGYIGVFIAGVCFTSTFTVAPAAAILFAFGRELNPVLIGIIGGVGAMTGDYLAFRFIKDRLLEELNPLLRTLHIYRPANFLKSKYFAWLAPVAGALIIASPLPDEMGLSLLGLTKISALQFLALAFGLNAAGIFLVALAAGI